MSDNYCFELLDSLDDITSPEQLHVNEEAPSLNELLSYAKKLDLLPLIYRYMEDGAIKGVFIFERIQRTIFRQKMIVLRPVTSDYYDYDTLYVSEGTDIPKLLQYLIRKIKQDDNTIDGIYFHAMAESSQTKNIPDKFIRKSYSEYFNSLTATSGWDYILKKKSMLYGYKYAIKNGCYVEIYEGENIQEELLAELQFFTIERWKFDDTICAFLDDNRKHMFMAHLENKVIIRVRLGKETIAMLYGQFMGQETLMWYTIAINIKYFVHSPLQVLLYYTASFCRDRGLAILDFGLGNEEYKARFANERRIIYTVMLPLSFRMRLSMSAVTRTLGASADSLVNIVIKFLRELRRKLRKPTLLIYSSITTTASPLPENVIAISQYEAFVDFARQYNFAVKRVHYQRFKEGSTHFFTLVENGEICCHVWSTAENENFYITELRRPCPITGNSVMLFDGYTYEKHRRKGYYTALLNAIQQYFANRKVYGYHLTSNVISKKGIIKTGYTFERAITTEKTPVILD